MKKIAGELHPSVRRLVRRARLSAPECLAALS